MRRETIKALELRRNTVMGEARRRSTMQTLGANNEFNRNQKRHRNNGTLITGNNVERIYSPNGMAHTNAVAVPNEGYEMSSEDERSNVTRNSMRHTQATPQPSGRTSELGDLRNSQM